MRRPVAAAVTGTPSWRRGVDDGVGGGVGDARVEGDLDARRVVVGHVPRRRLQQRVGEEGGEAARSSPSNSPSTKAMSLTVTGPGRSRWLAAAAAAMALARGSSPIV